MSVEEILARKELQEKGISPDSASETLALRNRVAELEERLAIQEKEKEAKALTPLEMRKSLDRLLEHYGVEPAEELIKLALARDAEGKFLLSVGERLELWSGMMQYRMPKLKATEVSGKVDTNITVTVLDFSSKTVIDKRTQVIVEGDRG